jgi:hypothetical protein
MTKLKHLLATSGTLDGIQNMVDEFFAGEHKQLVPVSANVWSVTRTAGTPIENCQVRKSGKRYRFEMA